MYAFGNRPDFDIVDEPFYAAYLQKTGIIHPMRDEVIASQPVDPNEVIDNLLNKKYDRRFHRYQKHMTQHILDDFDLTWMKKFTNIFLIRHPARVIKSFGEKLNNASFSDIGFKNQLHLFNYASQIGQKPIIIDSFDIRKNPRSALEGLCNEIGVKFIPEMLAWPKGGHKSDGVWARHWYGAVHLSEGFSGEEGGLPNLNADQSEVSNDALPYYRALEENKLKF
jgi:hypothetical protein